ncbi:metal-dependent hydrolase [Halegenticoccus tardaugens]|uniref:metal-dependent hydrolase n=1 Tax=Halegenticoccus tardaugens TaxID=2071624 RepID=UPI00100BCCF2|nr:metal-dependent hydrolase [Halegenticoccus tardaugens]
MLPWGHVAFGYLLYSLGIRRRTGVGPDGLAALAVGTQFPDLIDKPLSWTFGVLPSGRSFGHSVFVACAVVALALWLGRRYDRRAAGAAFAGGHVTHLVADSLYPLADGRIGDVTYLLWPVVPADEVEHGLSFVEFFLALEATPTLLFELALFAVAAGVWLRDGSPGLRALRSGAARLTPETSRE